MKKDQQSQQVNVAHDDLLAGLALPDLQPPVDIGFLHTVLPPPREGERFARFTTVDEVAPVGHNYPVNQGYDSVEALAAGIMQADRQGKGVWFGLATFGPDTNDKGRLARTAANTRRMKVYVVDVDCGEGKDYPTAEAAMLDIAELEHILRLPASIKVCSGYGVHLYWVLDYPADIDDWLPLAQRFKNALVTSGVVKIDPKITDDAARVMRPVGTHNKKRGGKAPVFVLGGAKAIYSMWQMQDAVELLEQVAGIKPDLLALPPGRPARKKLNSDLDYQPDFPKVSGHAVAEQCQQIRLFRDTGSAGNYEHWFFSAGTIKHSLEGEALVHQWSAVATGYSEAETQQKLDSSFKQGPALCESFKACNPDGCKACRFAGKIKTPLQAGREGAVEKIETATEGAAYLERFTVVPVGADVLLHDANAPRETALMRVSTFKLLHGNVYVGGKPMPEWLLRNPARKTATGVGCFPGEAPTGYLNLWAGFAIAPAPGDVSGFLDFVRDVICGGRADAFEYVLKWQAHMLQRPWELPETALILAGPEGLGKGQFVATLTEIVGLPNTYIATHAGQVGGNFNSHLEGRILVNANEAAWAGRRDEFNALKALITDPLISFEAKGIPARTGNNFARVIMTTNEGWAVPADAGSRRFVVLDVSAARKGDFEFFEGLAAWRKNGGAAAWMWHLLNKVDITGWNPRQIPQTAALRQQRWETLKRRDPVAAWWGACLEAGSIDDGVAVTDGWPEEISSRTLESSLKNDAGRNAPRWADAAKQLQKLLPAGWKRVDSRRNHTRFIGYALPQLAECRTKFESATGTTLEVVA